MRSTSLSSPASSFHSEFLDDDNDDRDEQSAEPLYTDDPPERTNNREIATGAHTQGTGIQSPATPTDDSWDHADAPLSRK